MKNPVKSLAFALLLALLPRTARAQEQELASLRAGVHDGPANLRLGRALRRGGHFDEAVRVLQAGVRDLAVRSDAQWEIARVRFDQGDFRASEAACHALPVGRGPADPVGLRRHVCMARAYLVWSRVALAQREITAAQAITPMDGELQLVVADAARLSSDVTGAETAYQAAMTALPGRDEPYLGLATLHETARRPDDAQRDYQRAVDVDGTDPAAALALGRFLIRRRDDCATALPLLQRAVDGRPAWAEALVALGEAQLAAGHNADALTSYQSAVHLSPTQPGAQTGLGRALVALGRFAEAEPPLREAVRQVGTDAQAFNGIADVLEHTGRESDAMSAWDEAIDRAPGDPYARMRAATLAHRTHQNALARAYLDRILQDDGAYAQALALKGDIAAEEGDRATARMLYTQALAGHGPPIDRAAVQSHMAGLDAPTGPTRRR